MEPTTTTTIKARDLREGMVLQDDGLTVVTVERSSERGHLLVTTDRAATPRGSRSFTIHGGARVRVTLESFRAHRSN